MVLCRFYQQGNCRYGNNCKYDHQMPGDNRYTNTTSVLLRSVQSQPAPFQQQPPQFQQHHHHHHQQQQPQQQQQPPPNTNTNIDVTMLVKSVITDMVTAEKGGQWLLSSYAPFKEKAPLAGFDDYSMEEIRFMFYEAVKKNTLEQYKYNLQILLQQAMLRNKALQNPSRDIINTLKQLYNTPQTVQENPTIFQQPPQQQAFFTSNNTTAVTQQQAFFTSNNTTAVTPQQQQAFFTSNNTTVTPQQQQQQQAFFSSSITAVKPQESIFAAQQPQYQFNQQQQQQPNIFQQNLKAGFNNPDTNNTPQQHSANIFNPPMNQTRINEDFYSKLDELTDNERNWFNNNDDIDDLNQIPIKPPTYDMCL